MNIAILSQGQNCKVKISSLRRTKIRVLLEVGFHFDKTVLKLSIECVLNLVSFSLKGLRLLASDLLDLA